MAFSPEVLDEILKDYRGSDDFYSPEGIMKQLARALVERTMEVELTEQLGYEKHDQATKPTINRRNGKTTNELRTDQGPMEIVVPRDREGVFEPQIAPKHQGQRSCRRVPGIRRQNPVDVRLGIDHPADAGSPQGHLHR
jgi:transposase-like protein